MTPIIVIIGTCLFLLWYCISTSYRWGKSVGIEEAESTRLQKVTQHDALFARRLLALLKNIGIEESVEVKEIQEWADTINIRGKMEKWN